MKKCLMRWSLSLIFPEEATHFFAGRSVYGRQSLCFMDGPAGASGDGAPAPEAAALNALSQSMFGKLGSYVQSELESASIANRLSADSLVSCL